MNLDLNAVREKLNIWHLITAGGVIIIIIIGYIIWSSLSSQISSDNTKHASNEQQIAQLEATYNQEKSYQSLSPTITKKLLQFEQAVPADVDFEVLVTEITQVAQTTNVELNSISYSQSSTSSASSNSQGLNALTVTISIGGPYPNLVNFLNAFYNPSVLPRLLIINSYSISPVQNSPSATVSINATAYFSTLSQPINTGHPNVP
jgi:Tfp pilus assembly protein PilO